MKSIDVDLNRFNSLCSLSCVESYLLYLLSTYNYDYKYLYALSYVNFDEILNYFFTERKQYEYYDGVNRLQQIASAHNLISIQAIDCPYISIDSDYNHYLLKLCPKYIEKTYGAATWRDDHYVLLTNFDETSWTYINDNPRDCKTLTCDEMMSAYAGSLIKIKLLSDVTDRVKDLLLGEFHASISEDIKMYPIPLLHDIIAARNALAVLKILRRRIYDYCSQYVSCDFMRIYLNELDRQFSSIEYMRLRNRIDYKEIENMFNLLRQKDIKIIKKLKDKMRKNYEL